MDIRTRITITKVTGESGLGTPFKVNLSKNISGITAEDLKFAMGDADVYVKEMTQLATRAETSAKEADGSAIAAAKSAKSAEGSKTAAKASEDAATSSATNASASEKNSKASEEAANVSAKTAKESESNAAAEAVKSATSATEADTSAKAAKTSEEAAKASELEAAESAKNAATSETNAKESETAAAESVVQVSSKVGEADTILTDFRSEIGRAETASSELSEKLVAGQQIVDTTDANAKAAAQSAQESASSAATALEGAKDSNAAKVGAVAYAAAAKEEADRASNQATAATNQAVSASNSADRAKEGSIAAKASADYVEELVVVAKEEVGKATEQATNAESEADRARLEADRAGNQIKGFAKYYLEANTATTDVNNRTRGELIRTGGTKATPMVTISEVVEHEGNSNSLKTIDSFTPVLSIHGVTANPQTGNIDSLPRATSSAYGTVKTTNTLSATVESVPTSRPIFLKFEDVDTKIGDVEKSALDATLAAGTVSSNLDTFKEEMTNALANKMDKSGEVTVESLYATGNIKGLAISGSSVGVYNGRGKQILLQFDYDSGSVPEIELQQANIAKYRYTFPEKSGKVALLSDIPEIGGPVEVPEATTSVHGTVLLSESISNVASTVPTTLAVHDALKTKADRDNVYTKTVADELFLKKADAMEEIGAATADKAGIMKLYDDSGTQIDGTLTQKYISNAFGEINGSIQSIREDYDSQISGLMTQYDNLVVEVSEVHTTSDNAMSGVNSLTPKVTRLESKAVMTDGKGSLYLGSYTEASLPGNVIVGSTESSEHAVQILGAFYGGDRSKSAPVELRAAPGDIDTLKYFAGIRANIKGSWREFHFPYESNGRAIDLVAGRYWCNDEYGAAKTLAQKQTSGKDNSVNWKNAHSFIGRLDVTSSDGSTKLGLSIDNNGSRINVSKGDASAAYVFPISGGALQTLASQEWVNAMIYTSDTSTIMKNPNSNPRLCLITKDTGEAGAYDFANNRWAFVHNQAGFEVFGVGAFKSSNDYASIILKKSDNRFVQIETTPHAGSGVMLNFIYRQIDGTNQHVMQLPYETGTIASREWTNTMIKAHDNGVGMSRPGGKTEIANQDDGNMGFWDRTTNRWVFVVHPNAGPSLLTTPGLQIQNKIAGQDQSKLELISPNGDRKIGLWSYNDGRTLLSAYAGGAWSNITIGGVGSGTIALREWVNTNYHSNLAINNTSSSWVSMRDQPCFRSGNPVATASASCILRQEHADRHFMIGGLGNTQFGIYMINKNQTTNGTNGAAYLEDNGTWRCHGNGSFNDVEIRSDRRKKSELAAIDSALTKLKTLTGYTYLVEDENKIKHKSAGLIAQDVQKVLPEVINEDSNGFLTMSYNGVHALVIEAIKELSDRIEQLEVKYGN